MALLGSDAGGGLGDDLGPDQVQADLEGLAADGLAVVGATMVSLASSSAGPPGWSGPAWGSSCQCLSRRQEQDDQGDQDQARDACSVGLLVHGLQLLLDLLGEAGRDR